jgi:GNAT superfamily N-acetyltransferase
MSSSPLLLTTETEPDQATAHAISDGLDAYNNFTVPGGDWKPLWIVGRDGAGSVQAGIRGVTEFDWLFVIWLWVAEPFRRQGVGSRLLSGAETIARERRCSSCYLDTFSFQAPEFYKRHGYQEFGRLENFPPGHSRIWLRKAL